VCMNLGSLCLAFVVYLLVVEFIPFLCWVVCSLWLALWYSVLSYFFE